MNEIITLFDVKLTIGYAFLACVVAFLFAPLLIKLLYRFNVTRNPEFDATLSLGARKSKAGVPIMGGILIIVTVAVLTYIFNWDYSAESTIYSIPLIKRNAATENSFMSFALFACTKATCTVYG